MSEHWEIYADWNPWHGCTKISPGCKYCYVYRQDEMYGSEISSSECRKTGNFNLPIKRKRDKSWKIESGKIVFTCFTSDFLLKDADPWRPECWQMMKLRSDLWFFFFTKHRSIIVAPMLTAIDLTPYLNETIDEVSAGGESGFNARPCNYDWILALREQCVAKNVAFRFHQTGAHFIKDGKMYHVKRCYQLSQAHKANIDYKIGRYLVPETVKYEWKDSDYHD